MDNMLMQAAREARVADFGTSSTDANQPQASTSISSHSPTELTLTPPPPPQGLSYAHLWGSASATRVMPSSPMFHTPTRNLTSPFTNSQATPAYTNGTISQANTSMRTGTALFNSPMQTNGLVAVSPTTYIARAGMHSRTSQTSTGSSNQRYDSKLIDALSGHRHRDLHSLTAERVDELTHVFNQRGMTYPYVESGTTLDELPFTLSNPLLKSSSDKLHHQANEVDRYLRDHQRQNPRLCNFERLGPNAYLNGSVTDYFTQADNMLNVLSGMNLLGLACAITVGNFVLTVDSVSTQVPIGLLVELLGELADHARALRDVYSPMTARLWLHVTKQSRHTIMTCSTMQLVRITSQVVSSFSRYFPTELRNVLNSELTTEIVRQVPVTILEFLRQTLLFEDSDDKHVLRRGHLQQQLSAPLETRTLQQAEQQWSTRKQTFTFVYGHEPFINVLDEIRQLAKVLPVSYRQLMPTLQEQFAFQGYPSTIMKVFQHLRALYDARTLGGTRHHRAITLHTVPVLIPDTRSNLHDEDRFSRDAHSRRSRDHRHGHNRELHREQRRRNQQYERGERLNHFDRHQRGDRHSDSRRHEHHRRSRDRDRDRDHARERSRSATRSPSRGSSNLSDERSFASRSRSRSHDRHDPRDQVREGRDSRDWAERYRRSDGHGNRPRFEDQRPVKEGHLRPDRPSAPTPPHRGAGTTDASRLSRPGSVSPSRHHSQSPGGTRTPAQVNAAVAPAIGATKRPGSPHPGRPSTPNQHPNTTQSDRRRAAMAESQAKIQAAYAEPGHDGPARITVVSVNYRIEPDRSVGTNTAAVPTTSVVNIADTTMLPGLSTENQMLSTNRVQRRQLLKRQLDMIRDQPDQPLGMPAALKMLRLVEEATLNAIAAQSKVKEDLFDSGAELSVSTGNDDSIISPIDSDDTVTLQSFEQVNGALTVLGSATKLRVSRNKDGGMSSTITKNYLLANLDDPTKIPNISITSVEELRARGHIVMFGTGDTTEVSLTVAGGVHRHQFTGHGAYVISPIDGTATELHKNRKLFYLRDFDATTQQDLQEKCDILADLASVYNIATPEVRLASYQRAYDMAVAKRQGVHATRALQYKAPKLMFPPNMSLHDEHQSTTGYIDPISKLNDDLQGLQVLAALHHDEHAEERDVLIQQLRQAVDDFADITPNVANISAINGYTDVYQGDPHVDFTGEDITDSTGPPPEREAESDLPEPNPHLATPLWQQFVALGTINSAVTAEASSLSSSSFFRPRGLRITVLQATSTLAILALYFLTVHPDSIVDVFSHHPATNIYDSVPVSQRHRVNLYDVDPNNLSTSTLQVCLQSQYRSMRQIDVLHIEDPHADQRTDVYGPIKLAVTDLSPDVVITTRSVLSDKTMGSKLNGSMKYSVEHPQPMVSTRIFRCDNGRTGANSSNVDSLSKQLEWLEQVSNAHDEYIDRKYHVPVSVGIYHYEDIAELVMNDSDTDDVKENTESHLVSTNMIKRPREEGDLIAPQPHPKRPKPSAYTVLGLDIGAASGTFCVEFLESNLDSFALAVDIISPAEFWATVEVPVELHPRLCYHQAHPDDDLDQPRLVELLNVHFPEIPHERLTDIHASFECMTLSLACTFGARDPFDTDWRHAHRRFDGRHFCPTTDKAIADDRFRACVIYKLLIPWVQAYPCTRVTVENPKYSVFLHMPDVIDLCNTPSSSTHTAWHVNTVDYCKLYDPKVDPPTSQKSTTLITYGYQPFDVECTPNSRCDLRVMLPDGIHHRYCIRWNENMPPDQERISEPRLRARIPRGVYRFLQTKRSNPTSTRSSTTDSARIAPVRLRPPPAPIASDSTTTSTPPPAANSTSTSTTTPSPASNLTSDGPSSTTSTPSSKRHRKTMPEEVAQVQHARFGHPNRKRLHRVLTSLGILKYWVLPSELHCNSCDVAKARQQPHQGTLKPAQYPNEIIHADLMNMNVPDVHGNLHSLTIVDGKSRLKTVYPMVHKSDAPKAFQKYFAYIRVKPTEIRVDAGGEFNGESATGLIDLCQAHCIKLTVVTPHEHQAHGLVERAHQTLLRQAHAMLLAANLGLEFWSYALRFAAHADQFLSSNNSQPAPYTHWHPTMPAHPILHAFGAPLIYRQQEPGLQRKLDPRGHHARYLGPAEQHGSVYVLDMDLKHKPIRITSNDLKRTYRERAVLDIKNGTIIDPNLLEFKLTVKSTGEPSIEEVLANYQPVPLPPEDKAKMLEFQEFCEQRSRELYATGMTGYEVNTTLLKEWHLRALRHAHQSTSSTTPTQIDEPKVTPPESKLSAKQKKQLCFDPDLACAVCTHTHVDDPKSSRRQRSDQVQMLICDRCDRGFHNTCLGIKWKPRTADAWYCPDCLLPGTEIQVQRTGKHKSKYDEAKVTAVRDQYGLTEIQYNGSTDFETLDLGRHRWRVAHVSYTTVIATINEVQEFIHKCKVPKSMQAVARMTDPKWRDLWTCAAYKEMDGLYYDAKMLEVVTEIPASDANRPVIPTMLLFKYKDPKPGEDEGICKCRCVLLGHRLDPSLSIPAPTPRMSTFRMLLSMAAKEDWHVIATDCCQAFANAKPMDLHYVRLPRGFPDRPYDGAICRLKRSLYGHCQAPYCWYTLFTNYMLLLGFKQNKLDPCLYQRANSDGTITYVLNYVDDALIFNKCQAHVEAFRDELAQRFNITTDKRLTRYLGLDIVRTKYGFELSQQRLVNSIYEQAKPYINKFNVQPARVPIKYQRLKKPTLQASPEAELELKKLPYRSLLGAVGYLATSTMPSICYAYKELARFSADFRQEHFDALLELITFIQAHPTALIIAKEGGEELHAASDADWNGGRQHLSTTGFIIFHGNNPISWASRTQRNTTRSVGESEFMALSSCAQEVQFLRHLQASIISVPTLPRTIVRAVGDTNHAVFIFNQELELTAASICTDSASTRQALNRRQSWSEDKQRHVGTAFHYVRSLVRQGAIEVLAVNGKDNVSDTLTKGYESTPQRINEFNRLARICHGYRIDTPRDLRNRSKNPEWQPSDCAV